MAVKLDNQEYPLTYSEQVWQSKQILNRGIKQLKIYKKAYMKKSILSYIGFGLSSSLDGYNIVQCLNNNHEENLASFICITPLVFVTNYYGIKNLKIYMEYSKIIRAAKRSLRIYANLEKYCKILNQEIPEITINNFIESANMINEYINDEQKILTKK